jgi:hypothetical protein
VTPDVAVIFILAIVMALMAITAAIVLLIVFYERSRGDDD